MEIVVVFVALAAVVAVYLGYKHFTKKAVTPVTTVTPVETPVPVTDAPVTTAAPSAN
jgi:hypothetical protein